MEYKGYPVVKGKVKGNSIVARCPYCGRLEHFSKSNNGVNPTRRKSHCIPEYNIDYYYIYYKNKEVNKNG